MEATPNFRAGPVRPGCPLSQVREKLRQAGLRPTLQRVCLGWLLFGKGDRHVCADVLFEEATRVRFPVSLATVYNTLHQFSDAGLLRPIVVEGPKTYFDTNTTEHHHFLIEGEDELIDVPGVPVSIGGTPTPPPGYEVTRVDVVVRIRRKAEA